MLLLLLLRLVRRHIGFRVHHQIDGLAGDRVRGSVGHHPFDAVGLIVGDPLLADIGSVLVLDGSDGAHILQSLDGLDGILALDILGGLLQFLAGVHRLLRLIGRRLNDELHLVGCGRFFAGFRFLALDLAVESGFAVHVLDVDGVEAGAIELRPCIGDGHAGDVRYCCRAASGESAQHHGGAYRRDHPFHCSLPSRIIH